MALGHSILQSYIFILKSCKQSDFKRKFDLSLLIMVMIWKLKLLMLNYKPFKGKDARLTIFEVDLFCSLAGLQRDLLPQVCIVNKLSSDKIKVWFL